MSIKIGNNILAKSSTYHPDLFDVKWSDHIINNISWLRADTFSWHSGELYNRAYEHLANDIENKTLQSETIEDITIQFYLADDGHKICPISEENNVRFIYEKTDIAWYYVIDTDNKRFKLPRTKFAFTGVRNGVGAFVEAGLPNITGSQGAGGEFSQQTPSGAIYFTASGRGIVGDHSGSGGNNINFDASKSNSIYGSSDTVQSPATEMYLYFYVGNYTQSDLENVAGEMSEVLNNKADIDLLNILSNIDFVVESQFPTAENNYTWYRKYKSGWVEQGGKVAGEGDTTLKQVSLPIQMADVNYTVFTTPLTDSNAISIDRYVAVPQLTTTSISIYVWSNIGKLWQVSGMAAQ